MFARQSRAASNQVAVWIEDARGATVATAFATRFTASGGYRRRPDSLADWVQASGWATADKTEVDAVSRPTPKSGHVSVTWNCADRPVPAGVYTYRVEGTVHWKDQVRWTGTIRVGSAADSSTATAEWLLAGVPPMVTDVRASFKPG